ncbi:MULTISPECIES: helix-turn-helix domain-containing protein [Actinomadura]|uniref:AraC-type DNA-binding protein n=1 Tax=Actinomadura madurae TaxID=1993 RepID=A0A1I5MDL7_9ACTN|nr:helix-turn-helix domain-containing protein [Actinomadura madurae]SFP07609.1 AraC-type DNA-binding protein [Actinomadura madurae]SPT60912.1 Transcriptional activator feaR [Actinomadura madurae]
MGRVFSTDQVPPQERLAYWHEVICRTFIQLDDEQAGGGAFRGQVRDRDIGPLQATRILTDPMTAERGSRHPRSLEEPLCLLAVQLHGRTIAQQDGRQAILLPGDLTLFDGTRPYRVDFQGRHFDHLVLRFPRTALEERGIDTGAVTVRRIALDSALGRLVTPFLLNVVQAADTVDPETGERLAGMSLDLIATALASVSGVERPPASPGEELLRRVRLYIGLHLSDPQLAPPKVAAAHNISLRQLHRLFARAGTTFGRWVREERLNRCREELGDPRLAGLPIAEIGARWGFPDASSLSRSFRARYGVSPREHRRAAAVDLSST